MPANAFASEPRNAMLRSYEPTLRERIAAYFMGDTRPSPERRQFATGIADILSYLPGTGNVIQGEEAYRRGDNKGAILAALPIPGAANVAARAEQEAVKRGIRAFHGSPHDFPAFDFSKIGSGEGAQQYGYGGYFAESENVAKNYRNELADWKINGSTPDSTNPSHIAAVTLKVMDGNAEDAIKELSKTASFDSLPLSERQQAEKAIALIRAKADLPEASGGHMYEVNINADPEQFIDYYKTLAEQTPFVRQRLQQKYPEYFVENKAQTVKGVDVVRPIRTGHKRFESDIAAAKNLQDLGIPGVTYLDAGSRAAGEGSRNYVVFDDKIVEIMRKYGLMGPIGAGIAAKILERQDERQEM